MASLQAPESTISFDQRDTGGFVVTPEMVSETRFPADIVSDARKFNAVVARKIEKSTAHKEVGSKLFRDQKYSEAIHEFNTARGYACVEQLDEIPDPGLKAEISDLFKKCSGNIAQCYMLLEKWESALQVIKEILTFDISDPKTFYRAGKCLQKLGKLQEAYDILGSGARMLRENYGQEPSVEYILLKNEVARELNQHQKELKELYQGILSPAKKQVTQTVEDVPPPSSANGKDPLFGVAAGVASLVALDKFRSDLNIETPEIVAAGTLVGVGLAGFTLAKEKVTKIASLSTVLTGIGFVGYKIWKSLI